MPRPIAFNKTGIFGLETIDVTVSNNTLTYVFEAHPFVSVPFNGLLLVHFTKPAPAGATGEMPIYFETRGMSSSRKPVSKAGGVPLTASDIAVPCYCQFFYNFLTGVVEAIAGVMPNQPESN